MIFFDNAEYDNFFNPLCCKNKRIYYECILQLIEKSKSVPLLYENDARDTLILYLKNCAYAVEDEAASGDVDENISSKKTENENASAILRYFRYCGWISEREIGRNGDNIATVMDNANIRNMLRILGGDPDNKVHLFLEYAGLSRDVADPWYTGDFEATYNDVVLGCKGLLEHLSNKI